MGIFDSLVGSEKRPRRSSQNVPRNPMQMLGMLKNNPRSILQQAGYTIPNGMTDPRQMVQYLLDSSQIDSEQLQTIKNAVSQRRR